MKNSLFSFLILLSAFIFTNVATAHAEMEDYPSIKLQALDKSTARTITFEAEVGSTIEYGRLFIKIQACRKAPALETPESAAFIQVWEVPPESKKSDWVFSGWMYASSPALSAMDHPVYDVWVLDCLGKSKETIAFEAEMAEQAKKEAQEAKEAEAASEEVIDSEARTEATEAIDEVIERITDTE